MRPGPASHALSRLCSWALSPSPSVDIPASSPHHAHDLGPGRPVEVLLGSSAVPGRWGSPTPCHSSTPGLSFKRASPQKPWESAAFRSDVYFVLPPPLSSSSIPILISRSCICKGTNALSRLSVWQIVPWTKSSPFVTNTRPA